MAVFSRQSIEGIVTALQKGVVTLDHVAHRLEEEAERRFCRPGEVNPVQLVKRIRKLARDLPKLQASCEKLLSEKQRLVDAAKEHLVWNHVQLKEVCNAAGVQRFNDDEFNSFKDSVGEWDRKLNRQISARGQRMSRHDISNAIARNAMAAEI